MSLIALKEWTEWTASFAAAKALVVLRARWSTKVSRSTDKTSSFGHPKKAPAAGKAEE